MKKALSMVLVLTMVLALALPAMAAEGDPITTAPTESSKDVTASYKKESHTETEGDVLYFTITWTPTTPETALAYTGEQATYTWNGAENKYVKDDGSTAAGWNKGTAGYTVKVENRSNVDLSVVNEATVNFGLSVKQQKTGDASASDYVKTITPLDRANKNLTAVDTGENGTPTSVEITYTYSAVSGSTAPNVQETGKVTVGQLKVVVSKANA